MDPSVVTPGPVKPPKWWIAVIAGAGAIGSLGTVSVAGSGTYDVAPFKVRLQAQAAPLGETVLSVQPLEGVLDVPARAEAGTHAAPILAKATIVGVSSPSGLVRSDRSLLEDPHALATFLGEDGKDAVRAFGIKLGILSLLGSGGAGLLLSFGRWRRILGAILAGTLTFGGVGLAVQQTYDASEFQKTCFVVEGRCVGGGLPDDIVDPDGLVDGVLPS